MCSTYWRRCSCVCFKRLEEIIVSKLSKKKVDVSFCDPITFEVVCTFNQCVDKFTIEGTEEITKYPNWKNGGSVTFSQSYHQCSECGRKVVGRTDKANTYKSYMDGILK